MATLTLDFSIRKEVGVSLKGFSLRKIEFNNNFIVTDDKKYALWVADYDIDGMTAMVNSEYLITNLLDVYEVIEFDKVKVKGQYPMSGEEIMAAVLERIKD